MEGGTVIELPTDERPAVLLNGDCLELMAELPDGSIDSIVTDPPYCSGAATESQRSSATHQGLRTETMANGRFKWFASDNMTTDGLIWLLRAVAVQADRLLTPGGSLCVFTDSVMAYSIKPAIESAGFRFRGDVIWDKGHFGCGTGFRPRHEKALHFSRRQTTFFAADEGDVITVSRVSSADRSHPAEKPVELFQRIIRVVTVPGGITLDPFGGSFASGVAAINLGMKYIGFDKSIDYVEAGNKRINDAMGVGSLFEPQQPAAVELFA